MALVPHAAEYAEELFNLLDGEHGGGLVQNDDLGAVVEHLDDLQGLLLGHRHVAHLLAGVQVEAELFGHLLNLAVAVFFQHKARLLGPHPDVIGGGEHIHQLEVLVDHADAQPLGVLGGGNGHRLAVHQNGAAVGGVDAGQHVHQGGLAGTVLSQQGENLSFSEIQVDVVVGYHRTEGLGDATKFHGIGFSHEICLLLF